MKNNVRTVEIGNNLYPTSWRAERYGMAEDELAKTFWNGVNLDYSDLQTRGAQVKAALAAGNEVHITNPNGTDLKLRVQGRPVLVSDGIISADDMKQGGAGARGLPAGGRGLHHAGGRHRRRQAGEHPHVLPRQADRQPDLTDRRRQGHRDDRIGPGLRRVQGRSTTRSSDPRKDLLGYIDLGINPNVKLPAASVVGTWVPAGTVTVGTGGNTWAGGDNSVSVRQHRVPAGQHGDAGRQDHRRQRAC